jgi:quinolinate synthase
LNSSLVNKIKKLKDQKNAIILAHNYQIGEVQDIADYVGDSLGLSKKAAKSDSDMIVFCGVYFMAETAAMLNPQKKVLIPDIKAGCPMARMITAKDCRSLRKKHPEASVVCYINTTADVKAESDICCTSSNAIKIVESIPESEVIFIPDKYLAHYVASKSSKRIIPWKGFCPTHARILPEHILLQKSRYPSAKVLVHPECRPEVLALADEILSTGGMCKYANESSFQDIIIGTEIGILHRLRKENPDKNFYPATNHAICPNMKLITLEKVLWSLQDMKYKIKVPESIRLSAMKTVNKMLEIS